MSTQFEFMMQLYMMNLMQQQQQQQQQLQQKDLLPMLTQLTAQAQQHQATHSAQALNKAGATILPTTTTTILTPNSHSQAKAKNRKNSQTLQTTNNHHHNQNHLNNNNCSSSSSHSSPNSNFSHQHHQIANNFNFSQQQQTTPSNSSLLSSSSSLSSSLSSTQNSSSPLSNLSLQQLLMFNSMPTIQQLMLQQQHQQQQQSLLLTPNSYDTSSKSNADLLADYTQQQQQLATYNYSSQQSTISPQTNATNSQLSHTNTMTASLDPNANTNFSKFTDFSQLASNQQFTAKHFLQSSTVTSTPTQTKTPGSIQSTNLLDLEQDEDISSVGDVGAFVIDDDEDHDQDDVVDDAEQQVEHENALDLEAEQAHHHAQRAALKLDQQECPTTTTTNHALASNDLAESSLYASSSGIASSTSSGSCELSNSKLLLCSGVQPLESTTDSFESSQMYTPIKQPADSSYNQVEQSLTLYRETATTTTQTLLAATTPSNSQRASPVLTTTNEESLTQTPHTLPQNILTPPSSEQMSTNRLESQQQTLHIASQAATAAPPVGNLTTASSLDTFLANEENLRNLKKVSSYLECENTLCRQENLREHFHCYDEPCKGKILSKKDDIIRHLKWHKKRKESLALGFARFSSSDDCAPEYGAGCAYNWKQTHYHCIYEDCPKVYVSTSDVQMHANFHRKNSEIVQEGFRRFRAHENCKIEDCPFYGKKISHYHCCREGCNHTFKNKADMDKHKTYHAKDYQLTQDGFKKILKTEVCPFVDCKFSTVCNHIHCVRENCNYILHSSTQMISHKRKHDRQDGEQAYQTFKKEKDMSEDESPPQCEPPATRTRTSSLMMANTASSQLQQQQQQQPQTSTPLSSLTAEQFLSRKRGRPPKKIQLPADAAESKRIKIEQNTEQLVTDNSSTTGSTAGASGATLPGLYPPYIPNFTNNPNAVTAAAAAAAAAAAGADPSAPNFQLTHLMALFQLQNPLFYQNLYPGGMANILGAPQLSAAAPPANANILSNLAAFQNAAAAAAAAAAAMPHIKSEFNETQSQQHQQQQYKE